MNLKNYVMETIEEVAPIVEEKSGLECDLQNTRVKLTNNILEPFIFSLEELDPRDFLIWYYQLKGSFNNNKNKLNFPKKQILKPGFKKIMGHELMHNAQHNSFPQLSKKKLDFNEYRAYKMLLEGDARLIEENFPEEYEMNKVPKMAMKFIGEDHYKTFLRTNRDEIHDKGKRILKQKFNGNRAEINKLYTAPVGELIRIFELNDF